MNSAILEPGRSTRTLSFLAGTSPSLIFMTPHHRPLTYRTLWDPGDIWAVVMCCWVQEPIHGIEKASPHLQGKVLRAGPTLATPQNVLRGESLPPRAAHADRWEDMARAPWQWLSHCARWANLSGFESLAHVVWPWAPGRDTASVSLRRSHLQAFPCRVFVRMGWARVECQTHVLRK